MVTNSSEPAQSDLEPPSSLHTKLQTILDDVFMAGLGIAGADDIQPEDHDKAILNTHIRWSVQEAEKELTALLEAAIGSTNSFESENTGRVWIDPDDLKKRLGIGGNN